MAFLKFLNNVKVCEKKEMRDDVVSGVGYKWNGSETESRKVSREGRARGLGLMDGYGYISNNAIIVSLS